MRNRTRNNDLAKIEAPRCRTDDPRVTLDEIRRRGQKPRHRQVGNWLARRWARPTAVYGTWIALRLGIPADAVTAAAGIAWVGEAIALAMGTPKAFMAGVVLGYLGFWLDHVDGQVARMRREDRVEGVFLDFWMHTAHACLRGFGLGWGLFAATQRPIAILAGMSAAFGWVMISHSNDAAYKAVFARLRKVREQGLSIRVRPISHEGGLDANSPTGSLRSLASWTLVKLQEPHCVLLAMSPLGSLLLVDRDTGIAAWWAAIVFWGVTAPLVAIVRLIRKVRHDAISELFTECFEVPADCETEHSPSKAE